MVVTLFRHTQAISVLCILSLCILIWMGFSFQGNPELLGFRNPLMDSEIFSILQQPLVNRILAGVFVFWQSMLINRMMVGQKILSTNTFYPALFYFLILSFSPQAIYLSPTLLGLTFIILSITKLLGTYLDQSAYTKVFDSSILMSIALLIHPPFLILSPIIWIGISIFAQVEWRHWALCIVGLLCPWFIVYSGINYFSAEGIDPYYFTHFLVEKNPLSALDRGDIISLIGFGIVALFAVNELLFSLSRKNIKARKSYILILWVLLLTAVYALLSPEHFHLRILVFALPLSAIISNYFYYQQNRKWLNFLALILFVSLFANHFIW